MPLSHQVFRFHDIAEVDVRSDFAHILSFFQAEYGYHYVAGPVSGLPSLLFDFRLDPSTPEGFTRHTHKLLARWAYHLTINPGSIQIYVRGNRTAVAMTHHMLLHPSLRWLAAGGGTLLLHAGAVVKNSKSLIFTGKGGVGKTTITSLILASAGTLDQAPPQNEWQLHADDYVFLGNHQSLAYLTRSHLYRGLLEWIPEIRNRLTVGERFRLEFLGAVRKYSGQRLKWAVRLSPGRLWPGKAIADTAIPAAILILERAKIHSPELVPVQAIHPAVKELLEMNFDEARHFLNLLQKDGSLDQDWLATWKDTESTLLTELLSETPTYRLVLPVSQSADEIKMTLLPLLEKLVEV